MNEGVSDRWPRDYVAAMLCAPVTDLETTRSLRELDERAALVRLSGWLSLLRPIRPELAYVADPDEPGELIVHSPFSGVVRVRVVTHADLVAHELDVLPADELERSAPGAGDVAVVLVCSDETDRDADGIRARLLAGMRAVPRTVIVEPRWAAALLVEMAKPMLPSDVSAANHAAFALAEPQPASSPARGSGG